MRRRLLPCLILAAAWLGILGGLHAQEGPVLSGQAQVTDGDTITIGEEVVRLLDIDAPELAQRCEGPRPIRSCGKASADALAAKVGATVVECISGQRDNYGRILARCSVDGEEL